MLVFLKLVGVTNAAIWLGSSVALVCVVAPAFYSGEMLRLLPVSHAGAAGLIVGSHYHVLHYVCGSIAIAHLTGEWLYTGKRLDRWPTYLVAGLFALALFAGQMVQPKLESRHLEMHGVRSTPQQRERARGAYRSWQAVMYMTNVMMILGLTTYVWQVTSSGITPRFGSTTKLRGLTNNVS